MDDNKLVVRVRPLGVAVFEGGRPVRASPEMRQPHMAIKNGCGSSLVGRDVWNNATVVGDKASSKILLFFIEIHTIVDSMPDVSSHSGFSKNLDGLTVAGVEAKACMVQWESLA